MAKAKNVVSSQGTGTKQVTLPVIARQQMHAVRSVADQVEKDSPGAIHAVHFNFSGKRMQGTIVYNRDRVRGDAVQRPSGSADEAAPPAQSRSTKPAQRKTKAEQAKGSKRPNKGKATTGDAPADEPMGDADTASTKAAAAQMRKCITDVTTEVVRALGGDSVTGGQYLCTDKTPLTLFGHELRGVRLPTGCPAADMRHDELWGHVEHFHKFISDSGDLPESELRKLRRALTPRAERASANAPGASATAAASSRPACSGSAFLSWPGPLGANASSSSPPPLFGGYKPTYGTGG